MENTILFTGNYNSESVIIKEKLSTRKVDPTLEDLCQKEWHNKLEEARSKDKIIWESETYRFESCELNSGSLVLSMSTVPFSIRKTMKTFRELLSQKGSEYSPLGIYSSCMVLTSDNKYIFVEDSGKYLDRKPISYIGGVLSKSEKNVQNGADLFGEAIKECCEETGCSPENIENIVLNAGLTNRGFSVCLLFSIKLNIDFATLCEFFKHNSDGEVNRLIGVNKNDLPTFLSELDEDDRLICETLLERVK